ncbi:hypothetical protein ACFLZM_02600 [Thermodesulfobacteriota bacterium]
MAKRGRKSISFDAMIKFFMKKYNIPTKRDIDKIATRIDRLEKIINKTATASGGKKRNSRLKPVLTDSDTILNVIKGYKDGVDFMRIKDRTGFEKKKIRNFIYRLNKTGRITRKRRGIYIAS